MNREVTEGGSNERTKTRKMGGKRKVKGGENYTQIKGRVKRETKGIKGKRELILMVFLCFSGDFDFVLSYFFSFLVFSTAILSRLPDITGSLSLFMGFVDVLFQGEVMDFHFWVFHPRFFRSVLSFLILSFTLIVLE
jgi:hypothetical protein